MSYSDCVNKPNPKINVVHFQHPWNGLFLPLKDREQFTILKTRMMLHFQYPWSGLFRPLKDRVQFTILKTGVMLRRRSPDSGEEAVVAVPSCWSWLSHQLSILIW